MVRSLTLLMTCCVLTAVSGAAAEKTFHPVDLQAQANQRLTDNFGRGVEGNNLADLPTGVQSLGDVEFNVRSGFLQLESSLLKEPKPREVAGIPVGKRFAKLHLLQAALFGNGSVIGEEGREGDPLFVPDGMPIGEYKVHYEDGAVETIPVVYGDDVRDWFFTENSRGVSRGRVVWEGDNAWAKSLGSRLRLYLSSWQNPRPKTTVVRLDFRKLGDSPAAPLCLAMTLEGAETPAARTDREGGESRRTRALVDKILAEADDSWRKQKAEVDLRVLQLQVEAKKAEIQKADAERQLRAIIPTQAIFAHLEEHVTMEFPNPTPLEDVLKYIKSATSGPRDNGIPIYVDPEGLDKVKKSMTSPVTLTNVRDVPLGASLRVLLKQLRLKYQVEDGLLTINAARDR